MGKRISAFFLVIAMVFASVPNISFAAVAKDDPELTAYLQDISTVRGFEILVEDFEDYLLEYYGAGLEDWEDFAELEIDLGEVIKEDLSNLDLIYEDYDLDETSLQQLLEENGDSIDAYIYIEDLDMAVSFYVDDNPLEQIFTEIGLTEEEFEALENHFKSIEKKLEDPAIEERLEELAIEMDNFPEFESIDELTDQQVTQIIAVFDELLDIFEFTPKFFLKKGDELNPITLKELFLLQDASGYSLLVQLYNLKGEYILDLELTAEMIGSEIIEDIGEDIKEVPEVVEEIKDKPATEKGGKLPNTASNFGLNGLIGLAIAAGGYFLYRRVRKIA